MREITTHKVNGLNEKLAIKVFDQPGPGNACHEYQVECVDSALVEDSKTWDRTRANCRIHFQNGPIGEKGVNGISNEALLAVVIDRLQGFQSGDYKCRENSIALTKLEEAMHWLHHRTRERMSRGVEGTNQV